MTSKPEIDFQGTEVELRNVTKKFAETEYKMCLNPKAPETRPKRRMLRKGGKGKCDCFSIRGFSR